MSLNIGLLGARGDNTGLGVQTLEFYRNMHPYKTLAIDIQKVKEQDGNKNEKFETFRYRFPNATWAHTFANDDLIDRFLNGLDVVFCCETPYDYDIFNKARAAGVKTVMQYNYEFLEYINQGTIPMPDVLAAPSLWHEEEVRACCDKYGMEFTYLPVPVNRHILPFKQRPTAAKKPLWKGLTVFLHVAGHTAHEDRNGTKIVLEAMKHVKSDIVLIIRSQHKAVEQINDKRIHYDLHDYKNYWEVYPDDADVMLLPRKFGGLCLPLNESMSCGLIPIMSDVSPQNRFLPPRFLVKTSRQFSAMAKHEIDCYEVSPEDLAAKMDELSRMPLDDFSKMSNESNYLAEQISWDNMKSVYLETFQRICGK